MKPAEIGKSVTDWPTLLAAARDVGVEDYFVGKEAPYTPPVLKSLRNNSDFLARVSAAQRFAATARLAIARIAA